MTGGPDSAGVAILAAAFRLTAPPSGASPESRSSVTTLPDVHVLEPRVFTDDRGFFFESFNAEHFAEIDGLTVTFVQDNHSRSVKGVLRGLHYQLPPQAQGKLVRVVDGAIFDVAVDVRRSSPTFGQWVGVELTARTTQQLWVPPASPTGFSPCSDSAEVLYKTTDYYAPECDRAIRWDDPDIGIAWPLDGAHRCCPTRTPRLRSRPTPRSSHDERKEPHMGRRYLVTGGAGFIGSNFIRYVLASMRPTPGDQPRCPHLCRGSRHGERARRAPSTTRSCRATSATRRSSMTSCPVTMSWSISRPRATSIDRSTGPVASSETNVVGTGVLLDAAYRHVAFPGSSMCPPTRCTARSLRVSPPRTTPLDPSSPYSSSKAGSDLLVHVLRGHLRTTDVIVTRCTNNYGPYQFPEKVIPLFVTNLLEGRHGPAVRRREERARLALRRGPLHRDPSPGRSRQARRDLQHRGQRPAAPTSISPTRSSSASGRDDSIEYVADRLGHDRRYAVDSVEDPGPGVGAPP